MSRLPDLIDVAAAETERFLENALSHRKPVPTYTGRCHNCEEKIQEGQFCDTDCRDDYEIRNRR